VTSPVDDVTSSPRDVTVDVVAGRRRRACHGARRRTAAVVCWRTLIGSHSCLLGRVMNHTRVDRVLIGSHVTVRVRALRESLIGSQAKLAELESYQGYGKSTNRKSRWPVWQLQLSVGEREVVYCAAACAYVSCMSVSVCVRACVRVLCCGRGSWSRAGRCEHTPVHTATHTHTHTHTP